MPQDVWETSLQGNGLGRWMRSEEPGTGPRVRGQREMS